MNPAAAAARKRSPWRHVVVPLIVALSLTTLGQSVAAAAQNLKPRVAAQQAATEATIRTSHPGAPDLTRVSINPGPRLASAHSYDAYGTEGPYGTGTNPNPYGYAGERNDGSGLQWLRARWYAPEQGRFLSRDTFRYSLDYEGTNSGYLGGRPSRYNPFGYADTNPARFRDPTGHATSALEMSEVLLIMGGAFAVSGVGIFVLHKIMSQLEPLQLPISLAVAGGPSIPLDPSGEAISPMPMPPPACGPESESTQPRPAPKPRGPAPEFESGEITFDAFARAVEQYLGPGAAEISPGRYISADGTRQVRFGYHEVKDPNNLHGHFEACEEGRVVENAVVKIHGGP